MGNFVPVILALGLNLLGVSVFTPPKELDNLPYAPYLIFLATTFFLLWGMPLIRYTNNFRKLFWWIYYIIEVIQIFIKLFHFRIA